MKAITVEPGKPGSARLEEVPEPDAGNGSVLVEAIAVGVCGTDVEIVEGKYGWSPPGKPRLVLGHESLGRVVVVAVGQRAFWTPRTLLVTGAGAVITESIQKIGAGGIDCLTGVGAGGASSDYAVADVAAKVVLKNNVLVGSVNANKRHWYKAGQVLARADRAWLGRLITRRERPENFQRALKRQRDDIKVVIQFSEA